MKKKLCTAGILLASIIVLGFISFNEYESRRKLDFTETLDEVAVIVDGCELTMRDMAFYIAYKECEIEEMARVYEPEDTGEYWNIYTNYTFLREEGKKAAMDMAVHDEIFYRLAVEEGMELSAEEEEHLANDQYDFWSDLEEEQRDGLGVGEEVLAESMRKIALAEKYQALLAEIEQKDYEAYSYTGAEYEEMLQEHTYEIKDSVWDRIHFGGVTVNH